MIFNTEVFEVADVDRFKEAMESFRESWAEVGGTDLHIYRNVDNPSQVISTMWWPDAETCRAWARDHTEEVMKAAEGVVTNMEPEYLWEEI